MTLLVSTFITFITFITSITLMTFITFITSIMTCLTLITFMTRLQSFLLYNDVDNTYNIHDKTTILHCWCQNANTQIRLEDMTIDHTRTIHTTIHNTSTLIRMHPRDVRKQVGNAHASSLHYNIPTSQYHNSIIPIYYTTTPSNPTLAHYHNTLINDSNPKFHLVTTISE